MLTDKEKEEIRRKLLALEEEPPVNGWNKIAAEIKPPRKPRPFWWLAGAALLLLLGSLGIYKLLDKNNRPAIVTSENLEAKQEENKPEPIVADLETGNSNSATKHGTKPEASKNAETKQSETENYSYKNSDQADNEKLTEQERGSSREKVTGPANPVQTRKPIIPIVVGAEKPKNKYNRKTVNQESGKAAAEPSITIVPANPEHQPETIVADNESNTEDFLNARMPVLLQINGFMLPDSMHVALLPDSVVKAVTVADTGKVQESKEWYIGVTFAPRYAFRSFTPTAADDVYITKLNNYKKLDPKRMGYEFGLNVGKKISPKLYLESALSLMQLQENVSYAFTNGKVDTLLKSRTKDGSYQAIPVYIEGSRQLESTFTYGGLRVGLNYYFLESSRSRYNLTFAGGANLLLKGRTREYLNGELKETSSFPSEENVLEQTNYNLLIGAGYNLTIRNKYELTLMPSLNYFLGSTFSKREPFGLKPYTLGVSVQLKRRFAN
ncbi:hypothetical protein [Pontibacter populi]|uniref:Outer membrane protein beta-barrel domain-containing protein n=1 Tax=Pontibacter populi TaxID=890055 RepID=A0ABV1RVR7_9BACT